MRKSTALIAATALLALPATASGAASDKASCMGQAASQPSEPGSKGAFASAVAQASERGFSALATGAARCEDRG